MRVSKFISFVVPALLATSLAGEACAQAAIENSEYKISVGADFRKSPVFFITYKKTQLKRLLTPQLNLVFTSGQPRLSGSSMDGQPGVVAWKTGNTVTQDITELGNDILVASGYRVVNNQLIFDFKEAAAAKVSLTVKFIAGQQAPVFDIAMEARQAGEFSLAFTGMPQADSTELDFVYQPLTWSWKRFPGKFALTEEAYANTAAVFANHHGFTEGLAVSPDDIPYRYALAAQWNNAGDPANKFWSVFPSEGPKGNSLFGMAIRNKAGRAQPVIYSPLPGTTAAKLQQGQRYRVGLVYLLQPGDWQKGVSFLLSSVFHYRSERQNARVSLNQTIDNMLGFAMNDVYSGWNAELKASDYRFDVPGTVKNVSALHPLGMYMLTGNENILKRRAVPMIEYVMSREKFLYTTSDTPGQAQVPSHLLNGPSVDIGELVALDQLTGGTTPAFAMEAARLFGKSRQLNMSTQTGGGSWQDYLARYRLSKNSADLTAAMRGADDYLAQVYKKYSHTFFDSPGLRDKGAGFTTDYGYRIYDLYELYMETGRNTYLQAAVTGAKQLLLWTRSNPIPPAGNITVNKNGKTDGIFPGRRVSAVEGSPFVKMDVTSVVPETEVPAWQTSLNGLIPEAPNTYAFGPVMLAHHAAWLLRLAHHAKDTLLRNAAYNAVLGRYANFPGYYFTSLHTDVYQRAGYPMHAFADVKYNAIFYNHVWPHLALLADFLVSDFYYRSGGKIDFPGTYAPGYAFLTSQVYGNRSGAMMGYHNIRLWTPSHALASDGVAFNYLMGHDEKDIFIAFANTAPQKITEHITLAKDILAWRQDKVYQLELTDKAGRVSHATMVNGKLTITLSANEITCVRIKDSYSAGMDNRPGNIVYQTPSNRFVRYRSGTDTLAQLTAMIIQPNSAIAFFYLYANQTEKDWQECTLQYKINDGEWIAVTDQTYPYEFDMQLPSPKDRVSFRLSAIRRDGTVIDFTEKMINQ